MPVNVPNLQGTYTVGQDGHGTIYFRERHGLAYLCVSIDACRNRDSLPGVTGGWLNSIRLERAVRGGWKCRA